MILKTVGIVYLFDFDGTLFGGNHWVSFWNNSLQCLKKGPYINPNDYDYGIISHANADCVCHGILLIPIEQYHANKYNL